MEHILEALQGWRSLPAVAAPAPSEDDVLLRHLAAGPLNSEELTHLSGLALPEVLMRLTELELEGRVAALQGSWSRLG
ncbi:putative Rossmann fold nucleotide-binding protein DprA/Smf involved in DNA uptake [Pseudomonas psychrotolerans]|uniref:Rossmann fold nucleotide-binding protein DprA/Smf involved in DNA uptake n=1 Tax=Pseudomonas oryzihabitans TaxID=47885 RepID=A0AAJ2EXE8_9PSED|nr:putative Rossmann fold nucleotide-binding protein DprA/Smf involved in DNA uptake [Pseudomonas psychrotolerans]MDR6356474.1 putative Rossmann fold nucleotide-binding protein DprA/Smf involved in DNA uptake [Pseudomonas psychrotolerans]